MRDKPTTNSKVEKVRRKLKIAKKHDLCTFCPMHGGENARNVRKHGSQKPKYKNKRR